MDSLKNKGRQTTGTTTENEMSQAGKGRIISRRPQEGIHENTAEFIRSLKNCPAYERTGFKCHIAALNLFQFLIKGQQVSLLHSRSLSRSSPQERLRDDIKTAAKQIGVELNFFAGNFNKFGVE